jgi:hypothetical protein
MKPRFIDLTGQTFNRLTATKRIGRTSLWRCKCQCGAETSARTHELLKGYKKSCGCLIRDNGVKMAEENFHREYKKRMKGGDKNEQ